MKETQLTSDEQNKLERRGFLVKNNYSNKDLFWSILNIFSYIGLGSIPYGLITGIMVVFSGVIFGDRYIDHGMSVSFILVGTILISPILNYVYSYFTSGKTFFTSKGSIQFGDVIRGVTNNGRLFIINRFINQLLNSGEGGKGAYIYGMLLFTMYSGIFFYAIIDITFTASFGLVGLLVHIMSYIFMYLSIMIIAFSVLLMLGKYIFQSIHPLYAFGNLGEKIQKLTPQIEIKSEEIQNNFHKDTNFRTLSDGFDSLSKTFSEIISLVIRLERVEKKANKGNLFDSDKYINSLRSDIVEPLKSLKAFLEKQKEELEKSQKELKKVRVRAGSTSELSSESNLSSKRSAPLLTELTGNISKLDEMIGKMS